MRMRSTVAAFMTATAIAPVCAVPATAQEQTQSLSLSSQSVPRVDTDLPPEEFRANDALIELISRQKPEEVLEALKKAGGVDTPVYAKTKMTPLMYLSFGRSNNAVEKIRLLLKNGASFIQRYTGSNSTALHTAAMNSEIEIVKMLVDAGADINAHDNEGWTPLHDAVESLPLWVGAKEQGRMQKAPRVISYLIEKRADIFAKTKSGASVLIFAARSDLNHTTLKTFLGKGLNPNDQTVTGETALSEAADFAAINNMVVLLEAGADPNHKLFIKEAPGMYETIFERVVSLANEHVGKKVSSDGAPTWESLSITDAQMVIRKFMDHGASADRLNLQELKPAIRNVIRDARNKRNKGIDMNKVQMAVAERIQEIYVPN